MSENIEKKVRQDACEDPTTIQDLIGRPSRYYTEGDFLTQDFIEGRVNIEVNKRSEILRVWFG